MDVVVPVIAGVVLCPSLAPLHRPDLTIDTIPRTLLYRCLVCVHRYKGATEYIYVICGHRYQDICRLWSLIINWIDHNGNSDLFGFFIYLTCFLPPIDVGMVSLLDCYILEIVPLFCKNIFWNSLVKKFFSMFISRNTLLI